MNQKNVTPKLVPLLSFFKDRGTHHRKKPQKQKEKEVSQKRGNTARWLPD